MSIAGRLQKPFRIIGQNESNLTYSEEFDEMVRLNREMALNFSVLSLGRNIQNLTVDRQILRKIASLSYAGDIRMNLKAEAGDKIDTILDGNFDEF